MFCYCRRIIVFAAAVSLAAAAAAGGTYGSIGDPELLSSSCPLSLPDHRFRCCYFAADAVAAADRSIAAAAAVALWRAEIARRHHR